MDGPGLFDDDLFADEPPSAPEPVRQTGPSLFSDAEPDEPLIAEPEAASGSTSPVTSETALAPAASAPSSKAPDVAESAHVPPSKLDHNPRPAGPPAPLALYRRYRPDSFADVIGQDHVTVPLQRALKNNRVNHAYLFSGPRGCGKTTSARILARCLNCVEGPTDRPCGVCRSCVDLARGGPGSIDVIEIDAASHGGVDDARDLRERAYFAPVASRYKIYIVDEAHMVTTAGFNALLKLVEEPPPHAKFIFATTEPEKVIGTIRSRTHHYPFRLVPPKVLGDYLASICDAEGVPVDRTALPLVVRAGAGSVRDSLSVLDQLLGGSGEDGVSYEQAAALLGYTPDALLDEIMDAFAAGDSAGVFRTVDKVIEVGQDPRRFAEDLLRRLRDLVILAAVPEAATNGLLEVSADQAQRLATQVAGMGSGELTRAAEVIATGLTEMRGTTAPRLHLELMCARVLLPGADADERGLHARMDRLERRVGMMGSGEAAPVEDWQDTGTARPARPERPRTEEHPRQRPVPAVPEPGAQHPVEGPSTSAPAQPPAQAPDERPATKSPGVVPEERPVTKSPGAFEGLEGHEGHEGSGSDARPSQQKPAPMQRRGAGEPPRKAGEPAQPAVGSQPPTQQPPPAQQQPSAPQPAASQTQAQQRAQLTAAELRRVWPNVLEEVKRRRRFTYMLLSQHAQVIEVADGALVLGFEAPGPRENFGSGGSTDVLADAIIEVIGVELRIQSVLSSGEQDARPAQRPSGAPVAAPEPEPRQEPQQWAAAEPPPPSEQVSSDDAVLDAGHNAEELLSNTFGAEIISVRDADG
ncbi:MAG: DNA polymerase III subunit gamma and tau [Propionibacteriaceae bacterium]|nr:DNA polymerase III subunit gamma and tau [Propionibacteriaceae bacterium]